MTTALAFSPDGKYLAAGEESGQVTVWDGDAEKPLGILPASPEREGKPRHVSALVFSPDGRTLAAAGHDGTLRLWDTDSSRPIGSALPTPGTALLDLAFSPDNKTLSGAGEHVLLQTYDITTGRAATLACDRAGAGLTQDEWRTPRPWHPLSTDLLNSRWRRTRTRVWSRTQRDGCLCCDGGRSRPRVVRLRTHLMGPKGRAAPVLGVLDPPTAHRQQRRVQCRRPGRSVGNPGEVGVAQLRWCPPASACVINELCIQGHVVVLDVVRQIRVPEPLTVSKEVQAADQLVRGAEDVMDP
ncbi:WD40 repeat domain-containing protein [Streptomyces sp. SudanB52_2052]|uniref:WD40 repeat domain-containing protein n=1 Tax=Streptomyces sp. SudanB52_2052 TaxID=3035276 RepID=UPI003F57ACFC